MRKRKLNGYKKLSAHYVCTQRSLWSEWRDLNSRPYGPEPYALPNCATPRLVNLIAFAIYINLQIFATKLRQLSKKLYLDCVFFGGSGRNRLQNARSVIYNHRCDGAWCSGSTWASDSHCVGSIPIAPANANTLLLERVFFISPAPRACTKGDG